MSFVRKMLGRIARTAPPPAQLRPEGPVYVIGDIHGRADLLERLLHRLDEARATEPGPLVFVGDYVDRGDRSREVLAELHGRSDSDPAGCVCLMGNHERMMLDFMASPALSGPRWLRNGGLQTLASFGIAGMTETADAARLQAGAEALAEALGPILHWLNSLPLRWYSGNLHVVHAAADPRLALDEQQEKTLIWGHPRFLTETRADGEWIAHGHTITDRPLVSGGRIALDTGAYYSGKLTAAAIMGDGEIRFIQT